MATYFKILFCITTFVLISACEKNKSSNFGHSATINYGKLAVGNYWIYQLFKIDNNGLTTAFNNYDSCYVAKDTLIHGNTYYKMVRPNFYNPTIEYLRDSSTCIVNNLGTIKFSSTDFSTIYQTGYATANPNDTIAKGILKMNNKDSLITVPMGTFFTSNYKFTVNMYPNWQQYYTTRYINTCYANNVGIVLETVNFLYNVNYSMERRLVRCHVN